MSKEGKEHTNKTSIKHWKPSPRWVKKREDLKMDWTRWQDTVEEINRNSSTGKCGLLMQSKETQDLTRHVRDTKNTETNGAKNNLAQAILAQAILFFVFLCVRVPIGPNSVLA